MTIATSLLEAESSIQAYEMANLSSKQTGLDGWVIYISTAQASHAARIKLAKTGASTASAATSTAIALRSGGKSFIVANSDNSGAPTRTKEAAVKFANANASKLLSFWLHGTSWMDSEVSKMKASLIHV